jgi:hypothetical protein
VGDRLKTMRAYAYLSIELVRNSLKALMPQWVQLLTKANGQDSGHKMDERRSLCRFFL